MSSKEDLIREGIERVAGRNAARALPGTVQSVDRERCVCDVVLADAEELVVHDVRLRATDDEQDKGFVLFPLVGADVLISRLNNKGGWFVSMFSELETVQLTIEGTRLTATEKGFKLERGSESLSALLTDLTEAVLTMVLNTNNGPTIGHTPSSQQKFTQLKKRIKDLLPQ